jgi:hypothetical protein
VAKAPAKTKAAPRKRKAAAAAGRDSLKSLNSYVAEDYHEIETDAGIIRVEPGHIVVRGPDGVRAMPPERFKEEFPTVDLPEA